MKFNRKLFIVLLLMSGVGNQLFSQNKLQETEKEHMEWFDDAKLGIFIHWGVYSVKGISESWAFFNNYISHENYMKQLDGFTAENYNPKEWVKLIQDAGAKYTVITSKHHDGISLWDTKAPEAINTYKHTPARKDVLTPFVEEVKKAGLRTGIYFSLPDWSHPYYDVNTRTRKRYDVKDDGQRWAKYVDYYQAQLEELSKKYKPDLLWFDGDWEHSSEEWKSAETAALLQKYNPDIIINSRLNEYGDYETPEQGVPVVKPASRHWELCYTMNDSWGYQPFDNHYKSPNMIIRTLVDCISMGGNLLLGIGPKADGTIPEEQVRILQELQRWTSKNGEAIYGTRAGLDNKFLKEKSAFSKNGKSLFIYLDNVKESFSLKGLHNKPLNVRLVGERTPLDYTHDGYNFVVQLPTASFDSTVTVLALDFEDVPIFDINRTEGKPSLTGILIDSNAQKAIASLVKWTDAGVNLFEGKITEDGDFMDSTLEFGSADVKQWICKHAEVLHNAGQGMPAGHYPGYSALSKDKQTLYLFVEGKPTGPIALKGIKNNIARIRIVGEGSMLNHQLFNKLYWSAIPGIAYIDIPQERLDKNMTVIAVLLDGPVELYRETVGAIESNL